MCVYLSFLASQYHFLNTILNIEHFHLLLLYYLCIFYFLDIQIISKFITKSSAAWLERWVRDLSSRPQKPREAVCMMCAWNPPAPGERREVSGRGLQAHRPASLVYAMTRDPGSKKAGQNWHPRLSPDLHVCHSTHTSKFIHIHMNHTHTQNTTVISIFVSKCF